jgi:FlaA1/EpsC-like NDP-sugar epimerase
MRTSVQPFRPRPGPDSHPSLIHVLSAHSILVTGGTGSFGHKCIERLLQSADVKRVVVYSRDELKQYEMT